MKRPGFPRGPTAAKSQLEGKAALLTRLRSKESEQR